MPKPALATASLLTERLGRSHPRNEPLRTWLLCGCALGILAAFGTEAYRVLIGSNFHTVVAGHVYRCAQPSGHDVEKVVHDCGIRTVINLRGCCDPWPWYVDEARATHRFDVAQEDIRFSAGHLPSVDEVRRLVEALDMVEYPILLHCRRGADRTGVAAAVVLLLQTPAPLEQARRQLGMRYGHVAVGRPAFLNTFFDLYQAYLESRGLAHAPEIFRQWAKHEYCPAECRCTLEALGWPTSVDKDEHSVFRIRSRNTSMRAWRFCPGSNAGIHGEITVLDELGVMVFAGRAGLFDAQVAPQESIELTFAIPPIHRPGRYLVQVDMVDEQHCEFRQAGSEVLEQDIEVR
ncbi:MAG TPA: tyrosine-protein phosphatase [Gemmataceae bacterium]|nr:tyrosine-protein phosphatase [Gemmataceae bacterium]